MLSHVLKPISHIFFTPRCVVCSADVHLGSLCASCLSLCHRCPDESQALFFYELAIRDLIIGAKFNKNYAHASILLQLIKNILSSDLYLRKYLESFCPNAVSYVPTHWTKRLYRGIDLPSMFAHKLAQSFGLPLVHSLVRIRRGHTQSSLERKSLRRESVKEVFGLKNSSMRYERLLLVDDIVTTGATFATCKKILGEVSKQVCCLSIAKTP